MGKKQPRTNAIIATISTICLFFCVWWGYCFYWSYTQPDKDSFIVLDKVENQAIKSTGKYSSELVYRTFVKIQYENGDVTTITTDNPIDAKNYVIGNKHNISKSHVITPFIVAFGYYWLVVFVGVFCILLLVLFVAWLGCSRFGSSFLLDK